MRVKAEGNRVKDRTNAGGICALSGQGKYVKEAMKAVGIE